MTGASGDDPPRSALDQALVRWLALPATSRVAYVDRERGEPLGRLDVRVEHAGAEIQLVLRDASAASAGQVVWVKDGIGVTCHPLPRDAMRRPAVQALLRGLAAHFDRHGGDGESGRELLDTLAAARRPRRPNKPLALRVERLAADAIGSDDWLDAIERRAVDAVVVRGLFEASWMAEVGRRLATPQKYFDPERLDLVTAPGQLAAIGVAISRYHHARFFEAAEAVVEGCRRLFEGGPDLHHRLMTTLSQLGGDRPVDVAGRMSPFNLRVVSAGGSIRAHAENNHVRWPGYRAIADELGQGSILSYYLLVSASQQGGELEVYDIEAGDPRVAIPQTGAPDLGELLPGARVGRIAMDPGSLLVFDGGRRCHGVSQVRGDARRVTIGGFVTPGHEPSRLRVFS
jgi:Carrier-protein-independent halogenase WelO5